MTIKFSEATRQAVVDAMAQEIARVSGVHQVRQGIVCTKPLTRWECAGCGATLKRWRTDCEYCRRETGR